MSPMPRRAMQAVSLLSVRCALSRGILVAFALSTGTAMAQTTTRGPLQEATVGTIASPSVYAVNAAALSAAMTFCSTKYRNINQGSRGAECFSQARNTFPELKLGQWATDIDRKCGQPATYNRCMTPEIGRLVYALNDVFNARGF